MTTYTIIGAAINSHGVIGCGATRFNYQFSYPVSGKAINSYAIVNCGLTVELYPDADIKKDAIYLIFAVYSTEGSLTLDDAEVSFVVSDSNYNVMVTKTTDDYSVITFGNTLVVHLSITDFTTSEIGYYTATITTVNADTYEMTGELIIAIFKTVERLYGVLQNPEKRVYGQLQDTVIRILGTLQNPEPRVYGSLPNPVVRLYGEALTKSRVYGSLPNPETRVYGALQNPEPRVCGTLQDPTTRLYGMLQEVEC